LLTGLVNLSIDTATLSVTQGKLAESSQINKSVTSSVIQRLRNFADWLGELSIDLATLPVTQGKLAGSSQITKPVTSSLLQRLWNFAD